MFAPQPLYNICLGAASQIAQMLIFLVVMPLEHKLYFFSKMLVYDAKNKWNLGTICKNGANKAFNEPKDKYLMFLIAKIKLEGGWLH